MNFFPALSNNGGLLIGFMNCSFMRYFFLDVGVWRVLLDLGWGVLELFEGLLDVCWHRELHCATCIVPLDGKSAILLPLPITQALIVFSYCVQQVLRILLADILYSKIIDNEGECNGAGFVLP